ncbi:hypothetical protein [Chitinophaga sp. YIM B06452]|uniref:hypothetical protein n=1 Tax=Chitinophaga sp. YIM B06452 TaxID=3082158 RepID=UPI0031FF369D
MLTNELKQKARTWINDHIEDYRRECGQDDYKYYLVNDCVHAIAPGYTPFHTEPLEKFIYDFLNGDEE